MAILVTGAAGFIGAALCASLLEDGETVWGLDNLNDYYDVGLKEARLRRLSLHDHWQFSKADLADADAISNWVKAGRPQVIVHLAAQAGVRYSLKAPQTYVRSNVEGLVNVLEACRQHKVPHLVFGSSSSVYGLNGKVPFAPADRTDHPVSLYAATKKSGEMLCHSYAHLFRLPVTALRFFTVYGPWGRPDMAIFSFTKNMLAGEPIELFNHGKNSRDFTYIDDVVGAIRAVIRNGPTEVDRQWNAEQPQTESSSAPYAVYNLGRTDPVNVREMVKALELALDIKANVREVPAQPGDVDRTFAAMDDFQKRFQFVPKVSLQDGINRFVHWYREYYAI